MDAQQLPDYIEQPPDAAGLFAIWPASGVPPGAEGWPWHEQAMQAPGNDAPSTMVRNVVVPTVTMFRPADGAANGTSLIVAPGGAFRFLMMDHEGYEMARWLTGLGVTAFVLRYRLAHMPEDDAEMRALLQRPGGGPPIQDRAEEGPPQGDEFAQAARGWAEEDGRQAIRFVRGQAAAWGLDPERVGIAGFSAGGEVALGAALRHDRPSRPDFAAGLYPGYTPTPVPSDAPPLFLAITDDDVLVGPISTARLYEAWHKAGRPAELHVFTRGRHGFGMRKQGLPPDAWTDLFKNWLAAQGVLPPAAE